MPRLLVGRCSNCGAAVSYFVRYCPRCQAANLPNAGVTVVALLVLVLIGAAIALAVLFPPWSKWTPENPPQSAPKVEAADDYGWIVKAMAECEVIAKQQLEVLRFLILPLMPTGKIVTGWTPRTMGMVGDSIALVSATDALLGLRNGVLALYPKEVTFAVKDPKTGTVYKWKPAIGVSELTTRERFDSLNLGFQVAEIGGEIEWGPAIGIAQGTCYWTNPVIRPKPSK
jgi:hypothetical protein